jgi:hypothetical protein
MKITLSALVICFGFPLSVVACLWDRDTPADEARGVPEAVAVLSGRFERNPPLYFEMRLQRTALLLGNDPKNLDAYDDAGVACDRLGLWDQAIQWMDKKRAELDKHDAADDTVHQHWYRYHANRGTFLMHRWIGNGADRNQLDQVDEACLEIEQALRLNPDAHFGREKYQLAAMKWIANRSQTDLAGYFPNFLGWDFEDIYGESTQPEEADEAVRGLAGLVVLGNAWNSIDVFNALNVALQRNSVGFNRGRDGGRNSLAYFAWLRCQELVDSGQGSLLPGSPHGEQLKRLFHKPGFVGADKYLDHEFKKLRADADAWHQQRTAFMTVRLKAGLHPDTDPNFWDGYTERPALKMPTRSVPDAFEAWQRNLFVSVILAGLLALLLVPVGWWLQRRLKVIARLTGKI